MRTRRLSGCLVFATKAPTLSCDSRKLYLPSQVGDVNSEKLRCSILTHIEIFHITSTCLPGRRQHPGRRSHRTAVFSRLRPHTFHPTQSVSDSLPHMPQFLVLWQGNLKQSMDSPKRTNQRAFTGMHDITQ
jgi:hypothetical protein